MNNFTRILLIAGFLIIAVSIYFYLTIERDSFVNPYEGVDWENIGYYHANFHTHTTFSDGRYDPHQAIDKYHDLNYDILALTDHDTHHHHVHPKPLYPWTALNDIYHKIKDEIKSDTITFGQNANEEWQNRYPDELYMLSVEGSEMSRGHHIGSYWNDFAEGEGEESRIFEEIAERDARILSPYSTLYLKGLGGFSAELGYRLNNHSEYGNNSTFSFSPAFNISESVKIYGSVSTGFKAPTLDELFGPFGANPDLDPQRSLYVNTGVEAYLLDQSLKLSAQYFNREIDDLIIFSTQGYINRDRQNDYGLELSADWLIGNSVQAGFWYNLIDGEITTFDADGNERTQSNLIRRPKQSTGIHAGVAVSDQLYIRIDGEYNGERQDLYFNPENNFAQEDITLDAYTLVNLYAEYKLYNGRFTVFGDVKNLFNTNFTEVYGFNTTGIAIKGGLRFSI